MSFILLIILLMFFSRPRYYHRPWIGGMWYHKPPMGGMHHMRRGPMGPPPNHGPGGMHHGPGRW